jgi:hypothetical protein
MEHLLSLLAAQTEALHALAKRAEDLALLKAKATKSPTRATRGKKR